MTLDAIVSRARSAIGYEVEYRLGCGGIMPSAVHPWDAAKCCDCSGFACWCCGISRQQVDHWLNTDAMVQDGKTPGGFFEQVPLEMALPGHLLVYGRSKPGTHGHVGVISVVTNKGPFRAIHCSSGNWKRRGDAIQETGIDVWRARPDSIAIRFLGPNI